MKIIDLLNNVAKGEAPKKIKYKCYIFKYTGDRRIQRLYIMENQDNYLLRDFVANINDEVEIIEEPKKIKPIICHTACVGSVSDMEHIEKYIHLLFEQQDETINKLNKVIDYINEEE